MDHPAKLLTTADVAARTCSVCGREVQGAGRDLRHRGEARRPRLVPARADVPAVRRAELVAAQALEQLVWTPTLTADERARAVVAALYEAGLIARRPRSVRAARVA
jgi:hypothetical protein